MTGSLGASEVVSQSSRQLNSTLVDQGHHRAAYSNDGIVVDSTARRALWLSDNKSEKVGKTIWSMEGVSTPDARLFSVSANPICILYEA